MTMTLQEISDRFRTQYKLQCLNRQITQIDLPEKTVAAWMAEGQSLISDTLKFIEDTYDISPVAGTLTYALPSNFGQLKNDKSIYGSINETDGYFTVIDSNLIADATAAGAADKCSLAWDGTQYAVTFAVLPTDTVKVTFYVNTNFYSASGASAQGWGKFDGTVYTGNSQLPDKYLHALILYMLGQIFMDLIPMFDLELERLNASRPALKSTGTYQQLGGVCQ